MTFSGWVSATNSTSSAGFRSGFGVGIGSQFVAVGRSSSGQSVTSWEDLPPVGAVGWVVIRLLNRQ